MIKRTDGDQKNFDKNWNDRKETVYNHWAKHNPVNQVQLAFSSHWEVFSQFLADHSTNKGKVLEVGSGRGSLSSYFSQDGWDCTLLDSSPKVLEVAKLIYEKNGHSGTFILGDANSLPFDNDLFDVVFSIGLLEHFEDVSHVISEQIRVLRPNGRFFAYIIPERGDNIQKGKDYKPTSFMTYVRGLSIHPILSYYFDKEVIERMYIKNTNLVHITLLGTIFERLNSDEIKILFADFDGTMSPWGGALPFHLPAFERFFNPHFKVVTSDL